MLVDSAKLLGQLDQAPPFDREVTAKNLSAVVVSECKKSDGPLGAGHVKVNFAASGTAATVVIDGGPFAGTPVGDCIVERYLRVRVPAFSGSPVSVGKSFTIE